MRIYDISMSIAHDMEVYKNKNEKRPVIKTVKDFSNGEIFESRVDMDMHTGTHIDMPIHIVKDGKTVENIDLAKVITQCKVFDFTHVSEKIGKENLLKKDINSGDFVILKTQNSYRTEFMSDFVYLDKTGAEYLKYKGVKGVGIDSLGIERNQPEHETHKILLGAGIVIIEGLVLKDIGEDNYFLHALPLKIAGVEASPVRAVLVKE